MVFCVLASVAEDGLTVHLQDFVAGSTFGFPEHCLLPLKPIPDRLRRSRPVGTLPRRDHLVQIAVAWEEYDNAIGYSRTDVEE